QQQNPRRQEQYGNRGVGLDEDGEAPGNRRYAEKGLVEIAHDDTRIWKKSVEIAARDIAEIFQQHRPWDNLAALQDTQFTPRTNLHLALHCNDKHDIIKHLNFDFAPSQTEPLVDLNLFDMAAPFVKAHLTKIVVLCLDFDGQCSFAVGLRDILVRQLLKICILENFVQGSDQIVIGAIALSPVGRGVACNLGAEIIIVVA